MLLPLLLLNLLLSLQFRMLGSEATAYWASVCFTIFISILPMLSILQWFSRLQKERSRKKDKRKGNKGPRRAWIVQHGVLLFGALFNFLLLLQFNFNAINGALPNFWVALMVGAVFESTMSTFDIRGTTRQLFHVIVFILY